MSTKKSTPTLKPENMKIDDKAVKKLIGEAITGVDGLLCLEGGFGGLLKSGDDKTRGVNVSVKDDGVTTVELKIVTEFGKNIPVIVNEVTKRVKDVLQNTAGLVVKDVTVHVTDTVTREEFDA